MYSDEHPDPQKAKLVRGDKGIDANIEFLEIVGLQSFGKAQVSTILEGVAAANHLKFKTPAEKQAWAGALQKRWMNMCRVLSQAEARKPKPKEWGPSFPRP